MNRDDIDIMWNKALGQAIKNGEEFTRYHFAALVAAAEREACAKVCKLEAAASVLGHQRKAVWQAEVAGRCVAAIRARGQE